MSDAALSRCRTYSPVEGWDTISAYLLVRGRIKRGTRIKAEDAGSSPEQVSRLVGEVCLHAPDWPAYRLRKPVAGAGMGIGEMAHPLDVSIEGYGLATELVALADEILGPGGWRVGPSFSRAELPFVAAKLKRGEVVAILAPCRL